MEENYSRGGSFWTPWRHQVFGARMREKNGRKVSVFSKDPAAAFGTESATREGENGLF